MHIYFRAPRGTNMVLGTLIYIIIIIVVIIVIIALLKFLFQLFFVAPIGIDSLDNEIFRTVLVLQPLRQGSLLSLIPQSKAYQFTESKLAILKNFENLYKQRPHPLLPWTCTQKGKRIEGRENVLSCCASKIKLLEHLISNIRDTE